MSSIIIVIPILLVLMFSLGLELSLKDFALFKKEPRSLLVGLIGQVFLLPLVAVIIVSLIDIPYTFKVGVVLIACCPGGASSNAFSMIAKGNVPLSISLTLLSSVITLFTLPIIMEFFLNANEGIEIPFGKLFAQNILMVLVPLSAGMVLHMTSPNKAKSLAAILNKTTLWLLLILATIFFVENRATIIDNFLSLGAVVTLLILTTMVLGALLSFVFKLKSEDKRTITIEIGMQNAAQAIALALSPFVFNSSEMAIPAIIYALMMNLILLSYLYIIKLRINKSRK